MQNKKYFLLLTLLIPIFFFKSTPAFAVGETCATDSSCCTPPQILQDGGGCPPGTYWIGTDNSGACQNLISCPVGKTLNCTTGACTSANTGTATCPGQFHIGGNVCVDVLKLIRENVTDTIYKIWFGEVLGRAVYVDDVDCVDGEVPSWDNTAKTWVCEQGGLWSTDNGVDIYYTGGNVGIGTNTPTAPLDVSGSVRFGQRPDPEVIGTNSLASGEETTASGYGSTAMGGYTTASQNWSTAIGLATTASEYASTAMGGATTASGRYSTSMGDNTTASGYLQGFSEYYYMFLERRHFSLQFLSVTFCIFFKFFDVSEEFGFLLL